MSAEIGAKAPELSAINSDKQPVKLADLEGSPALLVFFPGAFTGGCQKEACDFRDSISDYNDVGVKVYGISVDSFFVQNAFIKENELNFPFLSDYTRQTIEDFGIAINDFAGMPGYTSSTRSVFLLDANGVVQYKASVAPTEQPNLDELKEAVQKLS